MTKEKIIEAIAKEKLIEKIIDSYRPYQLNYYLEDLCQDIYISLLKTDDELIKSLYEKKEIAFYIRKIINNNLFSKTSPFYYNYSKFRNNLDNNLENE